MSVLCLFRVILIGCLVSCAQAEHIDCRYVLNNEGMKTTGTCSITGEVKWLRDVDTVYLISAGTKFGVNPEEMDEFKNGDTVSVRGTYEKSPGPFLYLSDLERAKLLKAEED